MNTVWKRQCNYNLYNEPVDWTTTHYAGILDDLTERIIAAYADEGNDGNINIHYEYVDGECEFPDFDDILLWRKMTDSEYKFYLSSKDEQNK